MNDLRERYERKCCDQAERLVEHICALDTTRVELAYRRLVELLEGAQCEREKRCRVSRTV